MFANSFKQDKYLGIAMKLTRREILEQLERLGVQGLSGLKQACREFEAYWRYVQLID